MSNSERVHWVGHVVLAISVFLAYQQGQKSLSVQYEQLRSDQSGWLTPVDVKETAIHMRKFEIDTVRQGAYLDEGVAHVSLDIRVSYKVKMLNTSHVPIEIVFVASKEGNSYDWELWNELENLSRVDFVEAGPIGHLMVEPDNVVEIEIEHPLWKFDDMEGDTIGGFTMGQALIVCESPYGKRSKIYLWNKIEYKGTLGAFVQDSRVAATIKHFCVVGLRSSTYQVFTDEDDERFEKLVDDIEGNDSLQLIMELKAKDM